MIRFIAIAFILFTVQTAFADNKSILGIDYLKVTKNQIIAEAMLEMEPALIDYYSKGKWAKATRADQIYALRGTAIVLGQDHISQDTYNVISEISPSTPLKFLKLDKEKYPDLWSFGNVVRLENEIEESKWLYKALHGKEWDGGKK